MQCELKIELLYSILFTWISTNMWSGRA